MDDIKKDILEVWKLRLKIERMKKKMRAIEWTLESDEYKQKYGEMVYKKARAELNEMKKEISGVEADQYKLEDKIKLPNPYLKESN